MAASGAVRRVRVRVTGTVQGVGFRPFVYRLADELGLAGWVLNDTDGVLLEVEGDGREVERFLERLRSEAPPLAEVEALLPEELAPSGASGFEIVASDAQGEAQAPVSRRRRDLRGLPGRALRPGRPPLPLPVRQLHQLRPALHDRPRRPLRPPADHDGRVRDVRGLPLRVRGPARPALSRPAERLPGLRAARVASRSRRSAARRRRRRRRRERPAAALLDGRIVAVKGLGGYHLACRADDAEAVAALRSRKHREEKPFALMAPSLDAARELVELGEAEEELLLGPERPIVLAPRLPGGAVAAGRRAALARARGDAALLAAPSPAARRRRHAAGDDQRQRLRRADRLPRRRRARAPRRDRRPLPRPRPPDPDPHRRLGRPRGRGRAAAGRCCCAARAATSRAASRCRFPASARCSPAGRS